jgi:predicted nucleic acid-binding protein
VIFLLDTNVLSENAKGSPEPAVVAFLRAIPVENIRLSAVVLAENCPQTSLQEKPMWVL